MMIFIFILNKYIIKYFFVYIISIVKLIIYLWNGKNLFIYEIGIKIMKIWKYEN